MKYRSGFVSNSSSSSFIVIGKKPAGISSSKLSKETAQRVIDFVSETAETKVKWDKKKAVYLTEFLGDEDASKISKTEHYSYENGQMDCQPYSNDSDEDDDSQSTQCNWVTLEESDSSPVLIRREHLDPHYNEMIFVSEVKKLARSYSIQDYILEIMK